MKNRDKTIYPISKLKELEDKSMISNLLNQDGKLIRYMSDKVRNNVEFCKISVVQNELSFTLIPESLRNDKSFVLDLYSSLPIETNIKRFINREIKQDIRFIVLETKKLKQLEKNKEESDRLFYEEFPEFRLNVNLDISNNNI